MLAAGRTAAASSTFENMVAKRATNWGPEYPAAYVGLARAAVAAGDARRAKKAYEEFFVFWKDADVDVPLLLAARREYAAMA